jgi:hypothetical protein
VKLKFGGQPFSGTDHPAGAAGRGGDAGGVAEAVWPDTFVDVDHNLNTAIDKIREVLGDSAETPRFVETLPRRGIDLSVSWSHR